MACVHTLHGQSGLYNQWAELNLASAWLVYTNCRGGYTPISMVSRVEYGNVPDGMCTLQGQAGSTRSVSGSATELHACSCHAAVMPPNCRPHVVWPRLGSDPVPG
jgi:hypothetical protein